MVHCLQSIPDFQLPTTYLLLLSRGTSLSEIIKSVIRTKFNFSHTRLRLPNKLILNLHSWWYLTFRCTLHHLMSTLLLKFFWGKIHHDELFPSCDKPSCFKARLRGKLLFLLSYTDNKIHFHKKDLALSLIFRVKDWKSEMAKETLLLKSQQNTIPLKPWFFSGFFFPIA